MNSCFVVDRDRQSDWQVLGFVSCWPWQQQTFCRNKMPENSARKPPTDFTIDCILAKQDKNVEFQRSPSINHPMNKVLDNPWISKCPLALRFNPSSHRKISLPITTPNLFTFYNPPIIPNFNDSVVNVTQHFSSVHNHFYPTAASSDTASSEDIKLLPKFNVYENKSCDNENIRNSLSLSPNFEVKQEIPSPSSPNFNFKCSICSKSFENCEILDVSSKN